MNKFVEWHKKQTEWWMSKLNVDWYGVAWIAFAKGIILTILIDYLFF